LEPPDHALQEKRMNTHIYYMITEQRGVELRRAAERARLESEVSGRRHKMRDWAPVTLRSPHSRRLSPRDMTVLGVEQASGGAR
jgi:hypothetical protein